eukprot:COSAG03_NODE_3344_length_2067_cov_3.244919_3_plen_228_part_00
MARPAEGMDTLMRDDGTELPTPARIRAPQVASPKRQTARTARGRGARVVAMPVPPDRRSTAPRRPSSAGRRTRRPSPKSGGGSRRSASARRVSTRSSEEGLLAAAGATWGMSAAAGADHRAAAPAWQDTQDEAQLETLRVALAAISAAEAELEQIRRHDEVHNHVLHEQEEELRERRQQVRRTSCLARQPPHTHTNRARLQADRLEKAELQIRALASLAGAPLLRPL